MNTLKEAVTAFTEALEGWLSPNRIPPMTHPLGKYWEMPDISEILIDDTHAAMTKKTFDSLLEYSCSQPSGAYVGKIWKRYDGIFDLHFMTAGGTPEWMLCWYGYGEKKNYLSTIYRKILVIE